MFVDTHAHLFKEYYDDVNKIVFSAQNNGIQYIISSGIDYKTNVELLTNKYDNVYITLGIHPECAKSYQLEDLKHIENNLNNSKVVAIGEIGLDYHYEGYDKNAQINLFKKQLDIATKYNLPVVIHSRDATQDTINILETYNLKGIIHSFSGSKEVAQKYIKMGYKLGINGVITFKNAKLKEVIKEIGIDNIVLESDSPYLTPEPKRGQKNNPLNIIYIANFLAEYLDVPIEKLAKITNQNVTQVFDKINL